MLCGDTGSKRLAPAAKADRLSAPLPPRDLSIAVVIPLFNGARFIGEAVESVLTQTLPADDIVVVDDGSTDDGPAIVEGLAAVDPIRLLRTTNSGQSAARNFGIGQARGGLIALLDQDDVWYPNHLAELIKPFLQERTPELGWVYSNPDEIDEGGRMVTRRCLRKMPFPHPKKDLAGCLSHDMFVLPSATMFSRKAFEHVGGFDERLSGYEDDDLFLRIFRAGFDNVYRDKSLTRWRIYGGSSSFSRRMAVSRMVYLRKLLTEYPDCPERGVFYTRDNLAPRFFPWLVREYMLALERNDAAAVRAALDNLRFLIRRHKLKVRAVMGLLLPLMRSRALARPLLPVATELQPLIRWLLR
jgi:glycosyltransferase involved in cell wall biosynthesis